MRFSHPLDDVSPTACASISVLMQYVLRTVMENVYVYNFRTKSWKDVRPERLLSPSASLLH